MRVTLNGMGRTPKTLQSDNLAGTVPTLADVKATLQKTVINFDGDTALQNFFASPSRAMLFCKAIDEGFQVKAHHIIKLEDFAEIRAAARELWPERTGFEDDSKFSNTRFSLILGCRMSQGVEHEIIDAAYQQLRRMLAAGRADLAYVSTLVDIGSRSHEIDMFYAAHDDTYMQTIIDGEAEPDVAQMWQQDAAEIREEVFLNTWLRTQISTEEFEQVRSLSAKVLHELYADIWDGGYDGHRARMLAKGLA